MSEIVSCACHGVNRQSAATLAVYRRSLHMYTENHECMTLPKLAALLVPANFHVNFDALAVERVHL